jgi:hypothetical protein
VNASNYFTPSIILLPKANLIDGDQRIYAIFCSH